ncbi:hypothetical protein DRO26_00020 [Candidatus Bathyarchaeota archaeon]|nr:MAG: hypothetical protein DRO26_00020 [Candidatus Bathyarchaeota archaeon]
MNLFQIQLKFSDKLGMKTKNLTLTFITLLVLFTCIPTEPITTQASSDQTKTKRLTNNEMLHLNETQLIDFMEEIINMSSVKNYEIFDELPFNLKTQVVSYENFLRNIINLTPSYVKVLKNIIKKEDKNMINLDSILEIFNQIEKMFLDW